MLPSLSLAQQHAKPWRIGFLEPPTRESRQIFVDAFVQRFQELGNVEGRDYTLEFRFANGRLEGLPDLSRDLVRAKVDLILASTTPAIDAAHKATRTIPIVMTTVGDPLEAGFAASFARPGGNITGRTTQAPDLMAKRVQLLKQALPRLASVVLLLDTRNTHEIEGQKQAASAAQALGVTVKAVEARSLRDIEAGVAGAVRERAGAILVFENAVNNGYRRQIVELAMKHQLPGLFPFREFVDDGGLMSFGASVMDNYREAAVYADKILKGARPAELPIQQPTKFELVVNQKAAKAMGLVIPQSVLLRADKVIE